MDRKVPIRAPARHLIAGLSRAHQSNYNTAGVVDAYIAKWLAVPKPVGGGIRPQRCASAVSRRIVPVPLEPKRLAEPGHRGMEKMLGRLLGADVEATLLPGACLGKVKADRGHIEQIIMSLVLNARDAMQRGGKPTIQTNNIELDEHCVSEHLRVTAGPYVMLAGLVSSRCRLSRRPIE